MDILDTEILNLWTELHRKDVEYIVVGGFAGTLHGLSRLTEDLDIWIKDSITNRKRFRDALNSLQLGDFQGIETMEFVPGYSTIVLKSGFELDIMTYLKGFPQERFDDCYRLAPIATIDGIPVKFLHINQLIEAKKAAGREKDLIDLKELERIKDIQKD